MAITRLSVDGYGSRRSGSFVGKQGASESRPDFEPLTRLSIDGYGSMRAGSFAGREAVVVPETPPQTGGGGHRFIHAMYWNDLAALRRLKRKREEEEILTVITAFLAARKAA